MTLLSSAILLAYYFNSITHSHYHMLLTTDSSLSVIELKSTLVHTATQHEGSTQLGIVCTETLNVPVNNIFDSVFIETILQHKLMKAEQQTK